MGIWTHDLITSHSDTHPTEYQGWQAVICILWVETCNNEDSGVARTELFLRTPQKIFKHDA